MPEKKPVDKKGRGQLPIRFIDSPEGAAADRASSPQGPSLSPTPSGRIMLGWKDGLLTLLILCPAYETTKPDDTVLGGVLLAISLCAVIAICYRHEGRIRNRVWIAVCFIMFYSFLAWRICFPHGDTAKHDAPPITQAPPTPESKPGPPVAPLLDVVNIAVVDGGDNESSINVALLNSSKTDRILFWGPQIHFEGINFSPAFPPPVLQQVVPPNLGITTGIHLKPDSYNEDTHMFFKTSEVMEKLLNGVGVIAVTFYIKDDKGNFFSNDSKWRYFNGVPLFIPPIKIVLLDKPPSFITENQ